MKIQMTRHRSIQATYGFLAVLLLTPLPALSIALQDVSFSMASGDRTDIIFTFDEQPPKPTGFEIAEPARISLDLIGVKSELQRKYQKLGTGTAQTVTILETQDRTRIVVALSELVGYTTQMRGNTLLVSIGKDLKSVARAQTGGVAESLGQHHSTVENVDFRRSEEGAGRVIITLSDPNMAVDVDQVAGRIVLTLPNAALKASSLAQQLDVVDFATPVNLIDVYQEGEQAVVEVISRGDYDYLAYQSDDAFIVEVKPVIAIESDAVRNKEFLYEGDKLSLNFQKIEIRAILQIVADFANLNLVASDAVAGTITLRLKDVPWDQALDIILKTKGLDKRVQGNVLSVAPATELADQERAELENSQEIAELAPLQTELIKVKYANASDIVALFTSQDDGEGSSESGETPQGVVSNRGSILVDDRTNAIIVTETPNRIQRLRVLLDQLDVPIRQVLIEARIVKASDSFKREAGIRWGTAGNISWGDSPNGIQYASSIEALSDPSAENLIVDLGTGSGKTAGIAFGLVNNDLLLDLELQLFESEGMGETISRPTIITSDKSSATVNSGSQIPYQSDTGGGATATAFVNATVGLTVTPQITADDRIILDLNVTNNSRGDPTPGGPPAIDIESIQTKVIVSDGETVVLGGLYQTRTDLIQLKTPVLGDLPVIGRFFRNSARTKDKDELLIFITPKIIRESGDRVR
jgi:type IV pilus assembly protein PilQ